MLSTASGGENKRLTTYARFLCLAIVQRFKSFHALNLIFIYFLTIVLLKSISAIEKNKYSNTVYLLILCLYFAKNCMIVPLLNRLTYNRI